MAAKKRATGRASEEPRSGSQQRVGRRLDPALMRAVIAENKARDELDEAERKYRIARKRTAREADRVLLEQSPTVRISDDAP